jgi:hypothetical protein
MNKYIYFILLSLSCYTANAQVKITTITDKKDHSFPLIHSKNATIANKINSYLQGQILSNKKIETSVNKVFEHSKYIYTDSIQQPGYSWIKYKVEANNSRVLSLTFLLESTGAYSEYYNEYYNFNLQTGKLIVAKDLFTPAGLNYIRKFISNERKRRINQFISEEYPHVEDSSYLKDMYNNCNQKTDENNFSITADGIVFCKEYCFPHADRPYDTDLNIVCRIPQLEKYLTEPGKKLLLLPPLATL